MCWSKGWYRKKMEDLEDALSETLNNYLKALLLLGKLEMARYLREERCLYEALEDHLDLNF